jgi:heavy metal translocating P-type ATPase
MNISYPQLGRLRASDVAFLSDLGDGECRKFVAALTRIPEVHFIEISTRLYSAEIHFDPACSPAEFANKLGEMTSLAKADKLECTLPALRTDDEGQLQLHRHGTLLSSWHIASDLPGRIRVRTSRLFRKKKLCQDVEGELMTVFGVLRFKVNSITCSVLVYYETTAIDKWQLLEVLERALQSAEDHPEADKGKYELLLCTAAVGLSAVAQFAVPVLTLPAAGLFLYCVYPTFLGARDTLFKERRPGVDVLDAIVAVMCLISSEIFAGAILAWCLSFGRHLLARAQEDSRRRLLNVFGKQPRMAYLSRNGVEIQVPLDQIKPGDLIAVHTGEMIAADGVVFEGAAVVDQHMLTGESVPVEKEPGSRAYASTLVVGGRLLITVEKAGRETTSAKISAILNDTAGFRLTSQSRGEELADKAVIPTLALASLGFATVGLPGATAIVNCDFGTGIRMAAPLALLSSLSACSNNGILVKDGRALEQMSSIDTVLFDKTGTLTQERPAVCQIHRFGRLSEDQVLTYAAAAERRLEHPIAAAIVARFRQLDRPFPPTDQSSYRVGYGISVLVDGKHILAGSSRFMQLENIRVSPKATRIESSAHDDGHSIVFVAVDGSIAGAIELAPQLRRGVAELVAGLRERGVRQLVVISGDHEKPTRDLSRSLGMDRYFAEVLPEDKARYVALLQKEGRKVCFVGDGINDSIALKRANVSVSMRGATSVAMDTAQVVFVDDHLWKLCEFLDVSKQLEDNVRRSWEIILVPNLACIAGAFFLGFGVMASVLANNVAAIAALANGLRPRGIPSREPAPLRMTGRFWLRIAKSLRRIVSGSAPRGAGLLPAPSGVNALLPQALSNVQTLLPTGFSLRRVGALLLLAGVGGVLIPGIPGWPLLMAATAIFLAREPRGSMLDRWLGDRFTTTRLRDLNSFAIFLRDMQRRFPEGVEIEGTVVEVESAGAVERARSQLKQ